MKKFRALSCLVFALCLVFYAIPRLPVQGISELATGFSMIWTAFAFLVIGSNLLYIIGVDQTGLDKRSRAHSWRRTKRVSGELKKRRVSMDI